MKQLTIKEKILACYPNVHTRCISKMVGCSKGYVSFVLIRNSLPIIKPTPYIKKLKSNKFK